jgi:hypothetical protein
MKHITCILVLSSLAGCATTDVGLAERSVLASYQSSKAPRDLADCISRNVTWTKIDLNGEGYLTFRRNALGVAMTSYDVQPSAGGSSVEIRSNASFEAGLDKVSACL